MLLKWGWVQQRISFKFRPAVWKKRYLVLTTMSIHVYKSEVTCLVFALLDHLLITATEGCHFLAIPGEYA